MFIDAGLYSIAPQIINIINNSQHFQINPSKPNMQESIIPNNMYDAMFIPNSYMIFIKHKIKHVSVETKYNEIINPILTIIEGCLSKYSPVFKSQTGYDIYHKYLRAFLTQKIFIIPDSKVSANIAYEIVIISKGAV